MPITVAGSITRHLKIMTARFSAALESLSQFFALAELWFFGDSPYYTWWKGIFSIIDLCL